MQYNKDGFNEVEHIKLCIKMNNKFMMSNSDVDLVRKHFTTSKYNLTSISFKRTINYRSPNAKTN